MNYRHAYHAGNFADVVKHVLLTRLIAYLKRKEKPFRVYDTHAGRGRYDLNAEEAGRTGEALEGIRRLTAAPAVADHPLFADYLRIVGEELASDHYPGSPLLIRRLLRASDRLSAYELHREDAAALKRCFAGDVQVKAIELDGWLALGAHLPPKERRGLVLIDPPFEKAGEVDDILQGLANALRRWPTGTYALWYPLKRETTVGALYDGLKQLGGTGTVTAEFRVEPYQREPKFVGSGLYLINAPYVFAEEARAVFAALAPVLGRGENATYDVFEGENA